MAQSKKWSDFSPQTRRLIKTAGALESALKIAALLDLARRPPSLIRGSKRAWIVSVALVNSLGALPMLYFVRGRRGPTSPKG